MPKSPDLSPCKESSVTVRKIENGYITSKTGKDYKSVEVFTPTNPMAVKPSKPNALTRKR